LTARLRAGKDIAGMKGMELVAKLGILIVAQNQIRNGKTKL
jgi:hypothetical protein